MKHRTAPHSGELLERRVLLASFATLNARGTLSVVGDAAGNDIHVRFDGSQVVASRDGQASSFAASAVKRIWFHGFGGADTIDNRTNLPATLIGGSGNDTLISGTAADSFDGGDGVDRVDFSARNTAINARLGAIFDEATNAFALVGQVFGEGDVLSNVEVLVATPKADMLEVGVLAGDANPTDVPAFHRPTVFGGAGNDEIFGGHNYAGPGPGATAFGGPGSDRFDNATSPDAGGTPLFFGESGDDVFGDGDDDGRRAGIDPGPGYDSMIIQSSVGLSAINLNEYPPVERFFMRRNAIELIGSDRGEEIVIEASYESITGGGGSDTIRVRTAAGDSPLSVSGGSGNDRIEIGASLELATYPSPLVLNGDAGNDTIIGGIGPDSVNGGDGNDSIEGHGGNDTIIGGGGNDVLVGMAGDDHLEGQSGDDSIYGGSGNDRIGGGSGRDVVFGESGDDLIFVLDAARDTVFGGSGFDRAQPDGIDSLVGVEGTI